MLKDIFSSKKRIIAFIVIVILMMFSYLMVFLTGGTDYLAGHLHIMYIPIVLAGLIFGMPLGTIIAIVGGIMMGPLMPADVGNLIPQPAFDTISQMLIFIVLGAGTGYFKDLYGKQVRTIENMSLHSATTGLPNIRYLLNLKDEGKEFSPATVLLGNKDYLIEIFGLLIYHEILKLTYENLINGLSEATIVILPDIERFWILSDEKDGSKVIEKVLDVLGQPVIFQDTEIYVEYYVAVNDVTRIKEAKKFYTFSETDQCAARIKNDKIPGIECRNCAPPNSLNFDLLSEFNEALKNNETYMDYHPIVDIATGKIFAFEALIRWNHKERGLLKLEDFIPLVESTQLIQPMMEWVLNQITGKIIEMSKKKLPIKVFMNVSGKNFYNKHFVEILEKSLSLTGVSKDSIGIEITETVLLDYPEESNNKIKELKEKGMSIAIDDFGTGYSSLAYIASYDVDLIKMDKFFIDRIDSQATKEILKAAVNISKQLHFKIIAEGVETKEQLAEVTKLGFGYVQGFYFSKPVHSDDLYEYYKNNKIYDLK